jgi:hypothetical protein
MKNPIYAIDGPDGSGHYAVRRYIPGASAAGELIATAPAFESALAHLPDGALLLEKQGAGEWRIARVLKEPGGAAKNPGV